MLLLWHGRALRGRADQHAAQISAIRARLVKIVPEVDEYSLTSDAEVDNMTSAGGVLINGATRILQTALCGAINCEPRGKKACLCSPSADLHCEPRIVPSDTSSTSEFA